MNLNNVGLVAFALIVVGVIAGAVTAANSFFNRQASEGKETAVVEKAPGADPVKLDGSAPPPFIANMASALGAEIVGSFGMSESLEGFVLLLETSPYDPVVVYHDKKLGFAFPGPIMSVEGENMTTEHLAMFNLDEPLKNLFAELQKSPDEFTFAKGKTATTLHVFYEPACGACKVLEKRLEGREQQITWVPVSFLGNGSANIVAAMVKTRGDEEVMRQAMTPPGRRALEEQYADSASLGRQISDRNMKLFAGAGFRGTPSMIWIDEKTGKIMRKDGLPSDAELEQILESSRKG